jgi:hypothetical protein
LNDPLLETTGRYSELNSILPVSVFLDNRPWKLDINLHGKVFLVRADRKDYMDLRVGKEKESTLINAASHEEPKKQEEKATTFTPVSDSGRFLTTITLHQEALQN